MLCSDAINDLLRVRQTEFCKLRWGQMVCPRVEKLDHLLGANTHVRSQNSFVMGILQAQQIGQ